VLFRSSPILRRMQTVKQHHISVLRAIHYRSRNRRRPIISQRVRPSDNTQHRVLQSPRSMPDDTKRRTKLAKSVLCVVPRLLRREYEQFHVMPRRQASVEAVNAAMQAAAKGELKGVLDYCEDPMVSIDFNHDPHSSCFAPAQTAVTAQGMVRVVSWYDNEWGFTNRMIDTACFMADL